MHLLEDPLLDPMVKTWAELPRLGMDIYDEFNCRGFMSRAVDDLPKYLDNEWLKYNAFLTGLSVHGVFGVGGAEERLDLLLEEPRQRTLDEMDDNIPAAAMWVIEAGQYAGHKSLFDEEMTSPSLRVGKWNVWRAGFEEVARDQDLHRLTRDWAGGALEVMARLQDLVIDDATI